MKRLRPEPAPAARLAASGLRATQQRISVLALFDTHRGHPTALDVHEALAPRHPGLSPKTVYEILDALVEVGLGIGGSRGRFGSDNASSVQSAREAPWGTHPGPYGAAA